MTGVDLILSPLCEGWGRGGGEGKKREGREGEERGEGGEEVRGGEVRGG